METCHQPRCYLWIIYLRRWPPRTAERMFWALPSDRPHTWKYLIYDPVCLISQNVRRQLKSWTTWVVQAPWLLKRYRNLNLLTKWLGGNAITLNGLNKVLVTCSKPELKIADLGCGGVTCCCWLVSSSGKKISPGNYSASMLIQTSLRMPVSTLRPTNRSRIKH